MLRTQDPWAEPNPELERFKDFVKKIVTVSKEELDEQRTEHERKNEEDKRVGGSISFPRLVTHKPIG